MQASTRFWVTLLAMLVLLLALAMEINRQSHAAVHRPADSVEASLVP